MGNSLIFTGLILLAGLAGGLIGSACGKRRNAPDIEARIAELEERLDALADHALEEVKSVRARATALENGLDAFQVHCLEQEQAIHAQLDEHDFLIGDTPTGGLLGRVGALEDAQKTHEQDAVIVNGWAEEIKALKNRFETFEDSMTLEMTGLREDMEMQNARG